MSDSTDTNELDNYGVWVKKPPKDIMPDTDGPDMTDDSFSLDSLDADLPDFDALDSKTDDDVTEPIFDIPSEETLDDPFAGVDFGDTTETTEESVSDTAELNEDNFSLDEISLDNIDFDLDTPEETSTTVEEPVAEETSVEASNDFEMTESTETSFDSETVDINLDSMEDGEIDLDNFLSDDSSSSGSSEETVDLSSFGMDDSSTDSVNLDDFLDGGEFSDLNSTGTGTTQKSEEIVDEDPLNINLSFDESANSFAVEEDSEESADADENGFDSDRSTGDDIDTESIDLAEFGVDEENGLMTMQGPEDAINQAKDETVNYDLKVSVDSDEGTSVSMSDVIAGNVNKEPEIMEDTETTAEEAVVQETQTEDVAMSQAGQQILQQLMGELTSLKNEIKDLKTELTDLKSQENEIKIESTSAEEENTGFFADGGDDDTIALSGDELDNILNSAEFLEETNTSEDIIPSDESEVSDEPVISEEIEETPVSEEETIETVSNGQFASTIDDDVFSDSSIFEEASDDDIVIEEPALEESITEETTEEVSEENEISEELPDEIEIPIVDDISTDSDIIVSEDSSLTIDTTGIDDEITISPIDEMFEDDTSIESNLTSDKLDYISEDKDNPVEIEENTEEAIGDLDLPSPSLDDMESEPVFEDTVTEDEPVIEETIIEEPVVSTETESVSTGEIPGDLKQEIKSVLSYMDQLLENLPDDKISEFAQSEHFVTYKKLFQELGLS